MSIDALHSLPDFAALPPAALRALADAGQRRTFAPGVVLWSKGARPDGLFIVLEGAVKVVRGGSGRQHVIHRGEAGATLGDVPLFAGGGYPATAIAARRTRCLYVGKAALDAVMAEHPALARFLIERLAGRVRVLVDRIDARTGHGVRSRLARRLLERAAGPDGWFPLGATQAELAEELGTVREVVARSLAQLRRQGALESDGRGRYRILDAQLLRDELSS